MTDKRVTLIVSDLHMGDGGPGDDFVDDTKQFARLVREQAETPEGREGAMELIVNGDFLELVQVRPELYRGDFKKFWASEEESKARVELIASGHREAFLALAEFQARGNQITLFPGNHDVDLVWPGVQQQLDAIVPGIAIETDKVAYERHGGRLRVSHGHLYESVDPANTFKTFPTLILDGADPHRLPMCPGTLFMLKFVNLMEAKYPFADNVSPLKALVLVLLREDRFGLASLAWLFTRFMVQYPTAFLSADAECAPIGAQLLNAVQTDKHFRVQLARLYDSQLGQRDTTQADVKRLLSSEDAIAELIERLFKADPTFESWVPVLDSAGPGVLGVEDRTGKNLLSINASRTTDVRAECIKVAEGLWHVGAQVVVLGHTHLPQTIGGEGRRYYNPGSWTRYVENATKLTLADLEDEAKFPYQLNYVRAEDTGSAMLRSEMITFEQQRGRDRT
jgi:UDP-2,3-diacylglucosamine pyrophosphatase LpxH